MDARTPMLARSIHCQRFGIMMLGRLNITRDMDRAHCTKVAMCHVLALKNHEHVAQLCDVWDQTHQWHFKVLFASYDNSSGCLRAVVERANSVCGPGYGHEKQAHLC